MNKQKLYYFVCYIDPKTRQNRYLTKVNENNRKAYFERGKEAVPIGYQRGKELIEQLASKGFTAHLITAHLEYYFAN